MSIILESPASVWNQRLPQRPPVREAAVSAVRDPKWGDVIYSESFALREATKLLDSLDIDDAIRAEVSSFLVSVLGPEATVPSVAFGESDGDVLLHWLTGPMSLEVEISADGPFYLWARDETGEIHCLEDADRRSNIACAKNIILRMGIRARQYNPRWRQQYLGNE